MTLNLRISMRTICPRIPEQWSTTTLKPSSRRMKRRNIDSVEQSWTTSRSKLHTLQTSWQQLQTSTPKRLRAIAQNRTEPISSRRGRAPSIQTNNSGPSHEGRPSQWRIPHDITNVLIRETCELTCQDQRSRPPMGNQWSAHSSAHVLSDRGKAKQHQLTVP